MARRKRGYVEDGYSSDSASSSSPVVDEGDRRRRRRRGGKEDAALGVFGDGSDGENEGLGGVGRTVRGVDAKGRKIDYLRGQAFVRAEGDGDVEMKQEDGIVSSSSEEDGDGDDYSDSEKFARLAPTEEEELETRTPFANAPTAMDVEQKTNAEAGLGFRPASFTSARGGIGAGVGSSSSSAGKRGGIGSLSMFQSAKQSTTDTASDAPPSSFTQSSPFGRSNGNGQANVETPKVSFKTGTGHGGKFDPAKYLAQMGWTGGGLGRQGEGIVNPIEVKQRPERAGIAFGGLKEKTKQAKDEARRRGEDVSTDEDERAAGSRKERKGRAKATASQQSTEQAWNKADRKPRKPKVEHRTYEQIVEEFGHGQRASGVGTVVDASGKEYSSISAALAHHAVPTADKSDLVEIRHNLRLICDTNTVALQTLANEGAAIQDRQKWFERDVAQSERRVEVSKAQEARIQAVLVLVRDLEAIQRAADADNAIHLGSFVEPAQRIQTHFAGMIKECNLDGALIGAMASTFKRSVQGWMPLRNPSGMSETLEPIAAAALKVDSQGDVMTPFESLLWNVWMPPVRSALSNEWDPQEPEQATVLFQSWSPLLPAFIRDNVSQQLILPRIMAAISNWNGKQALYKIVFPWMPLLGEQMDEALAEAKRRIRASLRTLDVSSGVPPELKQWRGVFRRSEWDSMLLHHVIEKLSIHLEKGFVVNPKAQDVKVLEECLLWKPWMPSKMLNKLLAARVVPKLIQTLYHWLTQPDGRLQEVAEWYEHWKAYFQQQGVGEMRAVEVGMQAALRLMEQALKLGDARCHALEMPDLKILQHAAGQSQGAGKDDHKAQKGKMYTDATTSSFRQIVEDAAAERDLIVQAMNKTEERSGLALYRISRAIDGRNGKTFYLDDDVIFVENRRQDRRATYDPASLTELLGSVV